MKIYCVASGSSGNCYVVSDGKNEIMLEAGVNPDKVIRAVGHIPKYALLTHEHDDHAKYSDKFDKYGVNVYCSRGTREAKEPEQPEAKQESLTKKRARKEKEDEPKDPSALEPDDVRTEEELPDFAGKK